jgi:hypothetical protein
MLLNETTFHSFHVAVETYSSPFTYIVRSIVSLPSNTSPAAFSISSNVTEISSLFVETSQSKITTGSAFPFTTLALFFALFVIEKDGVLIVNFEILIDHATYV